MSMLVTASVNHSLDALLELICVRLQLTPTQHGTATDRYGAVSGWLCKDGSPVRLLNPYIFPQGSLLLGTTTKPLRQAEFDLDLVCLLEIYSPSHPGAVYRLIWDRMWDSGMYRPMMKRLPRCIRLDYSGDFHLDVVPAVPDVTAGGNCILVPDLDANLGLDHPENDRWKPSNPRDYGAWFDERCAMITVMERYAMSHVDPVPEQEAIHAKPALKRSVQLFKRWRDVEFKERPAGPAVNYSDYAMRAPLSWRSPLHRRPANDSKRNRGLDRKRPTDLPEESATRKRTSVRNGRRTRPVSARSATQWRHSGIAGSDC